MLLIVLTALALLIGALICAVKGAFVAGSWVWLLPVSALGAFLVLVLAGFAFLLRMCKKVDQDKEQEEDDKFYRFVTDLVIESAFWVLRRFLLVCNHCNNADPIILLNVLRKYQLAFISKRENRDMFVIGPMMHKILCQLINRENDREALKTILKCIQIIKEDKASIAVFPEGGILSEDGKLHHFRPGVFKIAQKANVPIVVCTLKNTKDVVDNIKHLKGSRVEMKVLDVIPAEQLKGVTAVDISNRCYDLMAADMGPDMIAEA